MAKNTLGKVLVGARKRSELTREQVAKKVGITPGYLGILENDGIARFSDGLREKICAALKIGSRTLTYWQLTKLQSGHNSRTLKVERVYRQRAASKRKKAA